jgi:hypothetical protein
MTITANEQVGKQIQHTIMGGIMSGIQELPQTIIVDRRFTSTQTALREHAGVLAGGQSVYMCLRVFRGNVYFKELSNFVRGKPMLVETEASRLELALSV